MGVQKQHSSIGIFFLGHLKRLVNKPSLYLFRRDGRCCLEKVLLKLKWFMCVGVYGAYKSMQGKGKGWKKIELVRQRHGMMELIYIRGSTPVLTLKKKSVLKTKIHWNVLTYNFSLAFPGWPCGVMVKATDCGIIVSEFEFQSRYYVHFRANTIGKGMNPLILPAMG